MIIASIIVCARVREIATVKTKNGTVYGIESSVLSQLSMKLPDETEIHPGETES